MKKESTAKDQLAQKVTRRRRSDELTIQGVTLACTYQIVLITQIDAEDYGL